MEDYEYYMEFTDAGGEKVEVYVPDWAKWVAQDFDGKWYFFEAEPQKSAELWLSIEHTKYTSAVLGPRPYDWTQRKYEIARDEEAPAEPVYKWRATNRFGMTYEFVNKPDLTESGYVEYGGKIATFNWPKGECRLVDDKGLSEDITRCRIERIAP